MNLTEIQDLIKFVAKSGVTEVEIEKKDFKITIKSETAPRKTRGQEVYEAQFMHPDADANADAAANACSTGRSFASACTRSARGTRSTCP